MEDVPIIDEVNDAKTKHFLLEQNEEANDLLQEAMVMQELWAKNLQHYKLRKKSNIIETYFNNDTNTIND